MRKKYLIISIILVLIIVLFAIKPISKCFITEIGYLIANQLDKEEAERARIAEEGGIVRGKEKL